MVPPGPSAEEREQAEIIRSANEARRFSAATFDRTQVYRYLAPPADTMYALEYAFFLLGDIRGKTVVDLGCGKGENLIPLVERGARVMGIDISPDLIRLAERRIDDAGIEARACVGSAYETGLASESVDVVFCIALIHHLEIPRVRDEVWRILKPGGFVVLSEPIRFSRFYNTLRKLFPAHQDISDFEHPLTRVELYSMGERFAFEGIRYFRLPFVPLVEKLLVRSTSPLSRRVSAWVLRVFPSSEYFATTVVLKLQKK